MPDGCLEIRHRERRMVQAWKKTDRLLDPQLNLRCAINYRYRAGFCQEELDSAGTPKKFLEMLTKMWVNYEQK